jgi:hypothetical protein
LLEVSGIALQWHNSSKWPHEKVTGTESLETGAIFNRVCLLFHHFIQGGALLPMLAHVALAKVIKRLAGASTALLPWLVVPQLRPLTPNFTQRSISMSSPAIRSNFSFEIRVSSKTFFVELLLLLQDT